MCITLSLEDEEKRSTEIDNPTTDHQSDAMLTYPVGHTQDVTVDDNDDPNFDPTALRLRMNPHIQKSTLRAWIIGLIWAVLIPGVNQFFYLDTLRQYQPDQCIAVQKVFYNQHPPFALAVGHVNPADWLFDSWHFQTFRCRTAIHDLASSPCNGRVFNTLHGQETSGTHACGGISRLRFFYYVFIGYIIYSFLPSYLFTALSSFSWACWIAPNNAKVNQLFGVNHGLAMGMLTFDWGQISFVSNPFLTPWWAAVNTGVIVVFFYWFLLPVLYYTNVWYSAYLPLVSSDTFDNTGKLYNVSQIINSDTSFNLEAYKAYSPIFLPASFAISYGLQFAAITATLTHAFLYYRKYIWTHVHRPLSEQPDIHARLMSVYKEVPDWWYLTIFVTMFVFGVVVIEVWETDLPVWGFVLALLISFVYTLPLSVITATTNQLLGLNVITELIIGYALPGRPIAMMLFKTWGLLPWAGACVIATIIAGTVQLGVQAWMFSNIEGLCDADQKDGFICPATTVFGNASIIWGVIGPQRLFSHGQLYYGLIFFFLVGILAPLFQWILHKKFRIDFLKYINFPVAFGSTDYLPPATPLNYVPGVFVCFIFNYIIRRRNFDWWAKYNCESLRDAVIGFLTRDCLDSRVGYFRSVVRWIGCRLYFGLLIIFFTLQYPKNGTIGLDSIQKWWGNTVYMKTADYTGVPFKSLPEGEKFGPSSW
ncbi:OPT oligopeptide transporter protein-domain-containing protein [Russula aff. rugulosa BPL654]|nr:OPT oligopeptide transporter protein-domain-containing protein [Russula aff. rugulosa BPL654]